MKPWLTKTLLHQLTKEASGKLGVEYLHRVNALENTTAVSQQKWEWKADGSKIGQINQSNEMLPNVAAFAATCLISGRFVL